MLAIFCLWIHIFNIYSGIIEIFKLLRNSIIKIIHSSQIDKIFINTILYNINNIYLGKRKGQTKFIFLYVFLNYNENYFEEILNSYLKTKAISIIIPVFNTENYLIDCLNSVINQTLRNIEIICIDDGSTDNSSKILKTYSKYDDRFVIVNQKNKGSGYSRNRGINMSKGQFISFLDSDDMYYNENALELLYNKAKKNKATICGGGMEKVRIIKNQTVSNQTLFDYEGFINYLDYQYDYDYQRFIYKRKFLTKNNLYFPRYLRYQDPPFFIKAMSTAKRFYVIKNITNIYRKNIDKELNLKQVIDMFYGLKECLDLGEKMHLYKLYNTTLNRLNMKLFIKGAKRFSKNRDLRKIICKIIRCINNDIIKNYNLNFSLDTFYRNITNNI